jgi:hypothetical protein
MAAPERITPEEVYQKLKAGKAMLRRFPRSAWKASTSFLDLSFKGFSGRKLAKSFAQFT